ncbi:hypothetical protein [Reinekea blandensis]|uniref:Uncharacterized protein n=1 Tax=Reinekea blandensis MED297 TaxID=314283 RepID=A4B9B8_9GAMM|nr:hypothetical protein [Reinekea blandensis]EAR11219.1 hypothetical protein MED297_20067 [Reinekea sp. MED297] [Reinekea blandensis MED297]
MFIRLLAVCTAGVVFAILIWLRSQQPETAMPNQAAHAVQTPPIDFVPVADQNTATRAEEPLSNADFDNDGPPELQWVVDDFESQIQYPEQSRPIADSDSLKKYLPNQSSPIHREVSQGTFELTTDRLRFSPTEPITGTLTVPDGLVAARVSLRLMQNGQELARHPNLEGSGYTPFLFPALTQSWQDQGQLFVVATLTASGEDDVTLSTPVLPDLRNDNFRMTTARASFVEGAWLVIPIDVHIKDPGFYRLEGNLYSANTGEPLLHLMNEQELSSGKGVLPLMAHIRALERMGDPGDYLLDDLVLERMPAPPDFSVHQGLVPEGSIEVQGYPFPSYLDEDYVDADALARLEFLRSLSQ